MKLLYLFLLILPLPFVFAIAGDPIDKTAGLIKSGNVHELSLTFSPNVELTVMGEGDIYPKMQAEQILIDFFKRNQPRSYRMLHRIVSNPNYRFAVLILTTYNGVYRISFSLKKNKEEFELNELRIEGEKTN